MGTGGSGARADVVGLLLATQSVTLMNQFELGDLVVVERRDGASVFERPDPGRLSEWLATKGILHPIHPGEPVVA